MGRGGVRVPGIDPVTGEQKKLGRPLKPKIDLAATKGLASRVLAKTYTMKDGKILNEEDAWMFHLWEAEPEHRLRARIYLTDRRDGKPAQGVFVGDTRETARDLDFGDLPNITAGEPGAAGKPN